MPATKKKSELPSTIQRSEPHAQHIWAKTHDSAVETYGEGGRAHRVAYSALKHEYKKSGDKWVPKDGKGPSDPQAARGPTTRKKSTDEPRAKTGGGKVVTDGASKQELYDRAQKLDISGRSKMSKEELAQAVRDKNAKKK